MSIERLLVGFSIFTFIFAIGYAGSAAFAPKKEPATPVAPRPLDAKGLTKKLATLDQRLRETQASIDEVMGKLATVQQESERDATRIRLDVLFRLESGLAADIARTRTELTALQSAPAPRVE
jgi:hypothetical protein